MSELFNVNMRLTAFMKKQKDAEGGTTDENRTIGSKATLNDQDVLWSGQNYGWQSQESYDKLKEGPEFRAGHIALSRLGTDVNQAIGMGVNALPENVKDAGIEFIRQGVRAYQKAPEPIRTGINNTLQVAEDVNEFVSKTTNISPIITGELLSGAATAGAGTALKAGGRLAAKGAVAGLSRAVSTMDAAPVYALTIKNQELLAPGVRQGIAQTDEFAPGLARVKAQPGIDAEKREFYMLQYANNELTETQLKSRFAKVKKGSDKGVSSLETPDDPIVFEKGRYQNLDPTNTSVKAHQHHAATKAMTGQWVRKGLDLVDKGFGDDDDLIALFQLHRKLTGSGMGDVKSGIIDMPGVVHEGAAASIAGRDPKQTIHSLMRKSNADIEISADRLEKIIGEPKNMEELLERYVTFANEYLIPQKELSLKVLDKELNSFKSRLSGNALKDFDLLVARLNRGGTTKPR